MKKNLCIAFLLLVFVASGVYFYITSDIASVNLETLRPLATSTSFVGAMADSEYEVVEIATASSTIRALVADNDEKLELGLGGRTTLSHDAGMIFDFGAPGMYGFWMKDMSIPLDIVWIDEDKKVLGILSNLAPETYPNTFNSPSVIGYALEVNAGVAKELGIATGTILTF
ncbi:MAG: DUF192 domain-containing protein [Candidatus Paceibacterota bacterium]|jgi:hypothetical protein